MPLKFLVDRAPPLGTGWDVHKTSEVETGSWGGKNATPADSPLPGWARRYHSRLRRKRGGMMAMLACQRNEA